jgi:hypothetical protein
MAMIFLVGNANAGMISPLLNHTFPSAIENDPVKLGSNTNHSILTYFKRSQLQAFIIRITFSRSRDRVM